MTHIEYLEKKDLIMQDLCTRLPYNVRINVLFIGFLTGNITNDLNLDYNNIKYYVHDSCCEIKAYLRPMSSMTNKEKEIYQGYQDAYRNATSINYFDNFMSIDYLNSHHFDYRGLIEKGLALEAPEDMYKFE